MPDTSNAEREAQRKQLRAQIKETRAEMRALGIKRRSCFNGGLGPDAYRLNARMFALETELAKI